MPTPAPVKNAVDNQPVPLDLVRVLESWQLGPEMHIAAVLSWTLRAHRALTRTAQLEALDMALWYLARAVDSHAQQRFDADPNLLAQTIGVWGLTGRLREAVSYLAQGKWTAAHLTLTLEREARGG